jgi:hypothetical protein
MHRALESAQDEWGRLPDDLRDQCEPPDEMVWHE